MDAYDIMRSWDREAGITPRTNASLDLDVPAAIAGDWSEFKLQLQDDDPAAIIAGRIAWGLPIIL